MSLLIDAEYGLSANFANNERALLSAETSYDTQVYKKYLLLSELQAIASCNIQCKKRLDHLLTKDRDLMQYVQLLQG